MPTMSPFSAPRATTSLSWRTPPPAAMPCCARWPATRRRGAGAQPRLWRGAQHGAPCHRTGRRAHGGGRAAVPAARRRRVLAGLAGTSPRTRLAVLDHITSASALVLPMARMVAACHAAGVPVLVDGAQRPGPGGARHGGDRRRLVRRQLPQMADVAEGGGFLWAAPGRQARVHPVTISHGYDQGFLEEFDWTGTRDPSRLPVGAGGDRLPSPGSAARS